MKAITPIRSIDRYENKEGGCDYIVNLRPHGSKWKPIGVKNKLHTLANDKLYHHHVLPDHSVIRAIKANNFEISVVDLNTGAVVQNIDSIPGSSVRMFSLGNILVVNVGNEIRRYLYKSGSYTQLGTIPIPEFSRSKTTKSFYSIDHDKLESLIAKMFEEFSKEEENGYYRGNIMATTAYEMVDGSLILHNRILTDDLEFEDSPNNYTGIMVAEQYTPHPHILHNYGEGISDTYVPCNIHMSHINYRISIPPVLRDILIPYRDIIKSLNVYIHRISSTFSFSENENDYEKLHYQYVPGGDDRTNAMMWPVKHILTESFFSDIVFRKIAEIPFSDLIEEEFHEITLNLKNFHQQPILDVDNFSHHTLIPGQDPVNFNNAIHLPGTITRFGKGTRNDIMFEDDYQTMRKKYNMHFLLSGDRQNRIIKQVTQIETDSGTFYVENRFIATVAGNNIQSLVLDPFLSYPDRRAVKMYYLKENNELITSYDLSPHPSLNLAYYLNKEEEKKSPSLARFNHISIYTTIQPVKTFPTSNLYHQPYRMQVSETNNPFVFPAKYSYQVNLSEAIASCTSVAEEVGTGQRGQFPMFIFTDAQIYLLAQGQGDILYQQIIPIHRIGIVGKAVSVSRNVLFQAHDGLYIMDGNGQIQNISKSISGPAINVPLIIEKEIGKSTVPVLFENFLENSIFLYDNKNREVVISNPGYQFSFIYNQDHRVWYIRGEYFTQSLLIQSNQYFVRNSDILSMDESENKTLPFYVQSNILLFSTTSYKKINRAALRGHMKTDSEIKFIIFSELYGNYTQINAAKLTEQDKRVDILISRLPGSAKSFIFIATGNAKTTSEFRFFETEIIESLPGKIR